MFFLNLMASASVLNLREPVCNVAFVSLPVTDNSAPPDLPVAPAAMPELSETT